MTNGDPYERRIFNHRIVIPQPIKPSQTSASPNYVVLTLTPDRLKIEITGLRKAKDYFVLDVCEGGIVRIKHEGECKMIDEAAKLVLRPILFPEMFAAS